jgi:hypothetical protein
VKPVSVSYEVATLQNAVEGAIALLELQRLGGIEDEDIEKGVLALLTLVAVRLRDLGRVMRGTMGVETFAAPHNAAPEGGAEEGRQDVILNSSPPLEPVRKRRR